MKKISPNHPTLKYANNVKEICKPLEILNISYFAHVVVDNNMQFSAICSNPGFAEHYINSKYYNADIHMADAKQFNHFVIWDAIERTGQSLKLHTEAAQFGVQHTLTIIEEDESGKHFFHFANHGSCKSINQKYITHFDLLKLFILHFKEKALTCPQISSAHRAKCKIDDDTKGYEIVTTASQFSSESSRNKFIHMINKKIVGQKQNYIFSKPELNQFYYSLQNLLNVYSISLSKREVECLYFTLYGKTAKQIAHYLGISHWTVEEYLKELKYKLKAKSKSELINKTIAYLAS